MPRWISDEPGEETSLLGGLGITNADELFRDIPRKVRLGRMGLARGQDEPEVVRAIDRVLDRNRPYSRFASFLGGRIAVRHVPAAVDAIVSRSEFYTSYTPYQAEASQGILQSLFEFQSLWVELTGLDVANASLYDGATAQGEAMLLCRRIRDGHRFLVPRSLPWEERSVLQNYGAGIGARIEEIPYDPESGRLDLEWLKSAVAQGDVFGTLVDIPNGFGCLDEGLWDVKAILGEVPLVAGVDPLALAVIDPPGNWGADIVVGEGQGFGTPPSFGGPLLGLFACRREHVRLAPGRIVGATRDAEGRPAFTLTLQTREQHIRRSKATSNICTNQSLMAVAFVVYASLVGPKGLAVLQARIAENARTLAAHLGQVDGLVAPRFSAPFLGSFAVGLRRGSAQEFLDRLRRRRVLGGHPLRNPMPGASREGEELVYVAANESTTDREIERYARAARAAMGIAGERR